MSSKIQSIVFVLFLMLAGCGQSRDNQSNQKPTESKGPAKIDFEQVFYDFGDIRQGEQVAFVFEFTNTGKSPLLIKDAAASCGCTVPDYDKAPIAPGEKGGIEVLFDASGRRGNQYKTLIVKTNTLRGTIRLTIKANVIV